ncbi:hypothetical protein OZX68_03950 [Streptococcaceae bacterium ESL0729]|nr:hypothetical protein OZX68_03950 [Streptococcaceae bacterium ESL0729]
MFANSYRKFLSKISSSAQSQETPLWVRKILLWLIGLPNIFKVLIGLCIVVVALLVAFVVVYISIFTSFLFIGSLIRFPKANLIILAVIASLFAFSYYFRRKK